MFNHCIWIFLPLLLLLTTLALNSTHLIFRIWWDEAADLNPQAFIRVFQNWSIIACFILKWMGGLQTKIRWKVICFCQAPALAGLSLALFPNYPATRPGPANPADPTGIFFFGIISTCTWWNSATIKLSQAPAIWTELSLISNSYSHSTRPG